MSDESIAAKTVRGSAYSIGASAITMVLGFGRSVLMARLLTPEDFGVVAFALTFLNFTTPLRDFGLDRALIHRKPDEDFTLDEALAVHFALRLILIALFVLLLLAAIPVLRYFYPQRKMLAPVLLVLTVGEVAGALGSTPSSYLRKEMRFKELAVLQVLTSLSMTVVGPLMAWQGRGVWAIVAERTSGVIVATLVVWVFIRPWRLQWKFDWEMAKWYLNYGKFVFLSRILTPVTNQFDDYWVGVKLGSTSLGFYSKAYEFAQYPRRVVSDPIVNVFFSTFAKAQGDRLRLSKAYYRASSLVIRIGFLLGGVLVLTAGDFVRLFLGIKWLPMVLTFRLMVVYTLLIPLLNVPGNLANATGHPEFNTRVRVAQVVYFVPAVILSSSLGGSNGVALATDLMLLIGLAYMLYQIRGLVDVSFRRMFLFPILALLVGGFAAWVLAGFSDSDIVRMIVKLITYSLCYSGILLAFERSQYLSHLRTLPELLLEKGVSGRRTK